MFKKIDIINMGKTLVEHFNNTSMQQLTSEQYNKITIKVNFEHNLTEQFQLYNHPNDTYLWIHNKIYPYEYIHT